MNWLKFLQWLVLFCYRIEPRFGCTLARIPHFQSPHMESSRCGGPSPWRTTITPTFTFLLSARFTIKTHQTRRSLYAHFLFYFSPTRDTQCNKRHALHAAADKPNLLDFTISRSNKLTNQLSTDSPSSQHRLRSIPSTWRFDADELGSCRVQLQTPLPLQRFWSSACRRRTLLALADVSGLLRCMGLTEI